jgi:two-component system phosphate regulon sensor histidine kinase PhoR
MNETMLSGVLDAMEDGVAVFDLEGTALFCNAAAYALLHKKSGELKSLRDMPDEVRAFFGDVRSGRSETIELYGEAVRLHYQDLTENGMRAGAVLVMTDLGQQQRAERIRHEFTANVSHELKTPLTSISGYAEMIENGMAKDADVRTFAERIRRESNRMLSLVSDIITLSELDEREILAQAETIDLYALAEETVETLKSAAMVRGVTVRMTGEPVTVFGVRTLLSELVYNLLDNAIRYNRDNGTVSVRVAEQTLTVRDTGIGIPKHHQNRIFERFYRVDKSRSKATGGTGLGLAIVKHICEQHKAVLSLTSAEGIGTEITVRFPAPEQGHIADCV